MQKSKITLCHSRPDRESSGHTEIPAYAGMTGLIRMTSGFVMILLLFLFLSSGLHAQTKFKTGINVLQGAPLWIPPIDTVISFRHLGYSGSAGSAFLTFNYGNALTDSFPSFRMLRLTSGDITFTGTGLSLISTIGTGRVTSSMVLNGTLLAEDYANGSVTASKLNANVWSAGRDTMENKNFTPIGNWNFSGANLDYPPKQITGEDIDTGSVGWNELSSELKTYIIPINRPSQSDDFMIDFLRYALTLDSVKCSTYDSTFNFNILYGTSNHLGGTQLFGTDQVITTQTPSDTTIVIGESIPADNYLRIYFEPTGVQGEYYDLTLYCH